MIVERAANRIAEAIHSRDPEPTSSVAVLRYGLIIIMNTVLTVSLSLFGGALTGNFAATALFLGVFSLLRSISGGYHFNVSWKCTLLTVSTAVILPHVPISFTLHLILGGLSLLLFLIYAPSNLAKQSRIPEVYYPYLKVVSVAFVIVGLWMQRDVITLAILVQAISLVNVKGGVAGSGHQNN